MSILKTPADLGNVIRQRRKDLGWDQARLAQETGVSRQWIIDIEKGKPRAELQLVLRSLNVLGIELDAYARESAASVARKSPLALPDIDRIVEGNRASAAHPNAFAITYQQLTRTSQPQSVMDAAREQLKQHTSALSVAKMTHPSDASDPTPVRAGATLNKRKTKGSEPSRPTKSSKTPIGKK